ncbi:helicase-exonuclease AddAB subunit AddA [Salibacterium halotolerans]|uniref:ATP-dependent helicase/nuclease subunit A n=1 Tax=Salibacterium halotolerans TaxID=1884432 RepID=A0A1I5QE92_9BACI|nr:helicase-exonuclease AddAB subunit AddA [Salibacterium halotolerans]SFP44619.1 DNA helicase/exodeoxyribonuclease V, subunit A [Salibacterium halotolerans]
MNRPEKPLHSGWTDAQWEAVSASGADMLVSAAAGSGKTAVLVERIVHKMTHPDPPADVDRLLVVTFTKAAAAEMKGRISTALSRELNKHPGSLHLQRQLSLVNRAQISTLHSFCMSVIRKYYYKIDIDPQFRILDETEGELMRDEIMDDLLEEKFQDPDNEAFLKAVERFSSDRSDEGVRRIIRRLFQFSRAHPDPDEWLAQNADYYNIPAGTPLETTDWGREILEDASVRLRSSAEKLEQAESLCRQPGGPEAYLANLEEDRQMLERLLDTPDWTDLYEELQTASFAKLKTIKKNEDVDEDIQTRVKTLRDVVKKEIRDLQSEAFARPPEELREDILDMADSIHVLTEMVQDFTKKYQEAKAVKNVVDFADLEHLCLSILQMEGSEAAEEYRNWFDEIMVDEYQDTNHTQEAILRLISKGGNLFYVGDVKQSVYRFRLADPGLFLEKYRSYSRSEDGPGRLVHLDQNFRSRKEVIQAVNFVFRQLMDASTGEIDYDDAAELKTGNTDYPDNDARPELVLINKGNPISGGAEEEVEGMEDLETAQLEARWTAKRIRRMLEEGYQVLDKDTKQMRTITFRDIVILMRSMSWASTFMEECRNEGLPVHADISGGYFEAVEINVMLSLLQVIDNPRQDIPLASVLRSPIIGMNEEELASVRTMDKQGTFYDALTKAKAAPADSTWKDKAASFLEKLEDWRERARSEALSEFIWDLLQETGYYDFAGGLPGGRQRQANLNALYDRARTYEKTSFRGLFRFLRFIERIQERGDDLGTARALSDQEDVIRLMTIHKSKGLEFPVVILAGMNKMFNFQDLNQPVLFHKELGTGTRHIDPENRVMTASVPHQAVKIRNHKESIAEEMRILYVAMTRAREKLIMTGTLRRAEKAIDDWAAGYNHDKVLLPEWKRRKAKSFMDWVGAAVFRHRAASDYHPEAPVEAYQELYYDPVPWNIELVERAELPSHEEDEQETDKTVEKSLANMEPVPFSSDLHHRVEERLSWKYPYQKALQTRSKQTVSEFKKSVQDEYSEPVYQPAFHSQYAQRPAFMQETDLRPEEKGTALHTLMQHLPLDKELTSAFCRMFASELVKNELLTEEQAAVIDEEEVAGFFRTDIGQRMQQAPRVFRETAFTYGKHGTPELDLVLLQGAVDCIFQEADGALVLLDYKTDAHMERFPGQPQKARARMKQKYQSQIDLYIEAVSAIWETTIQEAYIYAFDGGEWIDMKEQEPSL